MKISQYSITNIAPFIQKAAVVALTDSSVQTEVERMHRIYAQRRRRIAGILPSINGTCATLPGGAFYYLIDVSRHTPDSVSFANALLDEERVGVVPGAGFGACAEGTVRITYAVSQDQIDEGLLRLGRLLKRYPRVSHGFYNG